MVNPPCPICHEVYTDPRVLPCGESVCLKCVPCLTGLRHFRCAMCGNVHRIPLEGYPINKFILNMLDSSDSHERDTRLQIANLKTKLESGQTTIQKVCQNIRNQIDLKSELVIARVTRQRQLLRDQIDMYEKNSIQGLDRGEKIFRKEFDAKISQVESRLEELKSSPTVEMMINSIRDTLDDLNKKIEELIFNQKRISFIENDNNQVENETLGFLHYSTPCQGKHSDAIPTKTDLSPTFMRFGVQKPNSQTQIEILDNGNYVFTFTSETILKWYLTSANFELLDSAYFEIENKSMHALVRFGNTFIIAYRCNDLFNHIKLKINSSDLGKMDLGTNKSNLMSVEACDKGLFVIENFNSVEFYLWSGMRHWHYMLSMFLNGVEAFRAKAQRFYFAYITTHTLKVFNQNVEQLHCIANQYGSCFQVLSTSGDLLFFDEKKLVFVYVNMKGEKMRQFTLDSFRDILHQPRIISTANDEVYIYGSETQLNATRADQKHNVSFTFGCRLLRIA